MIDPLLEQELKRYPVLSAEEQGALCARLIEGDEAAFDRLVLTSMRLVVKVASRYRGAPLDDLVAIGAHGLITGVTRYRADSGCRLSTYVTPWIKQHVIRYLKSKARAIRLPEHVEAKLSKWRRVQEELRHELCREPNLQELFERLGRPVTWDVFESAMRAHNPVSLTSSTMGIGDFDIEDESSNEEGLDSAADLRELDRSMAMLKPREREVIRLRFGLGSGEAMTLQATGEHFGLSRERIRQIELAAMAKLRSGPKSAPKRVAEKSEKPEDPVPRTRKAKEPAKLPPTSKPKPPTPKPKRPSAVAPHPSGIECIRVTEHMGFCVGNAIQHLWHAGLRGTEQEAEDLQKALYYVMRRIAIVDKKKKNEAAA